VEHAGVSGGRVSVQCAEVAPFVGIVIGAGAGAGAGAAAVLRQFAADAKRY